MDGSITDSAKVAHSVLDSLLEGCQVIDFQFRYAFVNDTVARQGQKTKPELMGRVMSECYPGIEQTAMYAQLQATMAQRTYARMENEFLLPDGSVGTFELRFVPVPEGVCILSLDITEEKRKAARLKDAEEQLRHSQKMEAVGRLAGGIAHDFNNLLSVILTCSELVLMNLQASDPLRGDVEEIARAGERAADLTRQLLTFSRQQVLAARVIDLNDVVGKMDKMLQRLLGADIDLVSVPGKDLGHVRVDPGSIDQVIMNLVVNARDAMPTGGKLTLETANVELDGSYSGGHLGVTPGPHVMLAVTDTGTGMNKETCARIFEPFFTTKAQGKGTGLGLSTVFGIVQQNGGHVWVYSEPGQGSTFKVYLPRVDAALDALAATTALTTLRGTETVLLVEDDEQVRKIARGILQRQGYLVLETSNAGEAMIIAERHRGPIHLLLSDVVMPQLSGPELARRLATVRREMKVLCMSGYTDDSIVRHGVLDAAIAFLQKPLTPAALAAKVREVLDTAPP